MLRGQTADRTNPCSAGSAISGELATAERRSGGQRTESLLGRAISIGRPETNQPEVNWTGKRLAPVFLAKESLLSFKINP